MTARPAPDPTGHQTGRDKSSLSPPQQRLLERLQDLDYGVLFGLRVERGKPRFPAGRVVRTIKNRRPPPASPRA